MTDLNSIWRDIVADDHLLSIRPDFHFDPRYYGESHPGLGHDPATLRSHFRSVGRQEGWFPNRFRQLRAQLPDLPRRVRRLIVDPRLLEAAEEMPLQVAELAFELIRIGHDADISDFSCAHYLSSYPDVAKAGMDPLEHYLMYGMREGRVTLADLRRSHHRGERTFDPELPTVLIALHELSNTGAPHVGLDLAREAAEHHNVIVAALRSGPLLDDARKTSCEVIINPDPTPGMFAFYRGDAFARIDVAICNSVESFPFIRPLVALEVPFASYLHEYSWYTFPSYKLVHTILFSDLLVFSSRHVRDSWSDHLEDAEVRSDDVVIIPQRPVTVARPTTTEMEEARARLSALIGHDVSGRRIVCGAGQVQLRKGTDIFAMTAQIVRGLEGSDETVFVWVGDGLNAEDTRFGAWLTHHLREIERSGASNLIMLPAGEHYRDVLRAADVMLLPSRLDPLPNVVFDALGSGCHVVLFDGASGFADPEYAEAAQIQTVEYGNPAAAAAAVLAAPLKEPGRSEPAPSGPSQIFGRILGELQERRRSHKRYVVGSTPLDVPILFSAADEHRALRVREREKVFTTGRRYLWRDADEARTALAASDSPVHRACSVEDYAECDPADLPAFNLHVHAYYVDGMRRELRSHAAYRHARRIIVTTDTEEKAAHVEAAFADEALGVDVRLVPNRGRDILPFLELMRDLDPQDDSEVWGHLHRKRSLATGGGEAWRAFMTAILLGGEERVSRAVSLAARPGVGLVAPFDPFFGQWNASRAWVPQMEERLGPLPANPMVYPMGNMFWVRASVVRRMNDLFPPSYPWPNEPIANDGTEFHLIERLWPAVSAQGGLQSVFVSKPDQPRRT